MIVLSSNNRDTRGKTASSCLKVFHRDAKKHASAFFHAFWGKGSEASIDRKVEAGFARKVRITLMNGSNMMLLLSFIRYSGSVCREKHFSSQEKHQPLIAIQLLPVFLVATLRSMEASLLPAQVGARFIAAFAFRFYHLLRYSPSVTRASGSSCP